MEFRKSRGGSSDGVSFINGHVPTAYFWSDWDEYTGPDGKPMPYVSGSAGSYPWWHKMDTYETMTAAAGDEATLRAGFQNTLDLVSSMLLQLSDATFVADTE